MKSAYADLLQHAPPSQKPADTWARLCCEQALWAVEQGCYGLGAVLVNQNQERLCSARNKVFVDGHYNSAAHAEMLLLDQLEAEYPEQDRSALTLYVSLQPCLMCYGRILLAGITRVRYLARDKPGGFNGKHLPAAWAELAASTYTSMHRMATGSNWLRRRSARYKTVRRCVSAWLLPGVASRKPKPSAELPALTQISPLTPARLRACAPVSAIWAPDTDIPAE
ncbi:nucleoside deaminase [Pseudomonas anguilliseptica]|uniref:tRNA(Arg) A34 adenosine deaminase TadA n=1 Tax=Pseudomonas anguilliseptica TaxID=53406 RepID=A0A1H5GT68_PSEAG|nr:nucleoside deaminase [Pseudomonas anguilliseptica]SEE18714.1 tRNA(Arg) A34 adenosine deaminase TadA [Pseudomonas anguilliseptica]